MMYYPLIEQGDVRRQETDMFLKRVYKGIRKDTISERLR